MYKTAVWLMPQTEKGNNMIKKKYAFLLFFLLPFLLNTHAYINCQFSYSRAGSELEYGLTYRFDATKSGSGIESFQWDFGDGDTGSGAVVLHTFDSGGGFPVTLTCKGSNGETNKYSTVLTVFSYPKAVIDVTSELEGVFPLKVSFDCSNSTDADGDEFTCYWTSNGQVSYEKKPTFNYYVPGVYSVALTVFEKTPERRTDKTEMTITLTATCSSTTDCPGGFICMNGECVKETATSAIANFYFTPQNPNPGDTVSFDASISEPSKNSEITDYSWDFGDGFTASGMTAQHTYTNEAVYSVTLNITDSSGKSDSAIKFVKVGSGVGPVSTVPSPSLSQTPLPTTGNGQLIITNSEDKLIGFKENEAQKTTTVKWTIFNIGESTQITNIIPTNCSNNLSCAIANFDGQKILATNEFFVVEESVVAKKPAEAEAYDLGLKVYFSSGSAVEEIESPQTVRVELAGKKEEKFHVKLNYADQNFCIGFNGVFGRTGERVRPRVLLSWDWADIGLSEYWFE